VTASTVAAATPEDTEAVGERLAAVLRAGDLVLLVGPLGAGKTTFVRGLARGLGVLGPVTSPTFVLAREHEPAGAGPGLVHVDAYRLAGPDDLESLDLLSALDAVVTVVEWGSGLAEWLAPDRLEVRLERGDDDTRTLSVRTHGPRWEGVAVALGAAP
jgi:tRNA threonylcarbamoyladenosine biosynthesis protein TsaE